MRSVRPFRFFLALMLASLVSTAAHAQQLWTGILTPTRATNWSSAGVVGGIPARTTTCATLNPGATAAQINSALASCAAGQTVLLNAGSYPLSGCIDFGSHSNLTLRGAGANLTLLVFSSSCSCAGVSTNICAKSSDINYSGGPSNTANWTGTGPWPVGTTQITLSSTANLKVGSQLILDQISDTSGNQAVADTGAVFTCSAYTCTENGGTAGNESGYQRGAGTNAVRDQQQVVNVTAISGSTVTFTPGLRMPNWRASQAPGAWWATNPISYDGVENLSVDGTTSSGEFNVQFFNCQNCWVKGIRSIAPGRAHVIFWNGNHCTARDSYFYSTQNAAAESYGVEEGTASDNLIENNIFQAVAAPEMTNSACPGCVYGYNFAVNDWYSPSSAWDSNSAYTHSVVDFVLYEGNVADGIYFDLFHGTGQFVTAFRNRYNGQDINNGITANSHTNPFIVYPYHRYINLIGNVIGQTGYHTTYTSLQGSSGNTQDVSIYVVGTGTQRCCLSGDPLTVNSLMRWGNYDTVSAAVRFVTSEVPSSFSDSTGNPSVYVNGVPSSQTLPPSFYYSSKPSWWPSAKAWPPIGPDVTGGNIASVAGHANTIPAQDCYTNSMVGPANGVGSVLLFDAATCYASGSVQLPAPPTNLNAVVQ